MMLGRSTMVIERSTMVLARCTMVQGRSTMVLGRSTIELGRSTTVLGRSTMVLGRSTMVPVRSITLEKLVWSSLRRVCFCPKHGVQPNKQHPEYSAFQIWEIWRSAILERINVLTYPESNSVTKEYKETLILVDIISYLSPITCHLTTTLCSLSGYESPRRF